MPHYDIAVVGAGPAGSTLALRLARAGFETLLLDKKNFPRPKVCGEFINPFGVKLLEELGLRGLVERAAPQRVAGHRLHSAAGATLKGSYAGDYGLAIPRTVLDELLLKQAAGEKNIRVVTGCCVEKLSREREGGFLIEGRRGGGEPFEARVRLVAGTDGSHSRVAKIARFRPAFEGTPRYALMAHYEGVAHADCGEMFLGKNGYAGLAPMGRGKAGITLVFKKPAGGAAFDSLLENFPRLRERLKLAQRGDCVLATGWVPAFHSRAARRGVFLAGDAAYFIDPFTGEGMSLGMLAAKLAADALITHRENGSTAAAALLEYNQKFRRAFRFSARRARLIQKWLEHPAWMHAGISLIGKSRRLSDALVRQFGGSYLEGKFTPSESSLKWEETFS